MADCVHMDFNANVECHRLTRSDDDPTVVGYVAEVMIWCAACDEPMVFHGAGLRVGGLSDRPCISVGGQEVRMPFRPLSADPNTGLGIAGFEMRVSEGLGHGDN